MPIYSDNEMEDADMKEWYSISVSSVQTPNRISWSADHKVSVITTNSLHILGRKVQRTMHIQGSLLLIFLAISLLPTVVLSSNITGPVFGTVTNLLPAAFGDFNSDELTDLFAIQNQGKTLQILLAADQEPLLRPHPDLLCHFKKRITSVVPGDFDGDTHMDVLVTVDDGSDISAIYISWGGSDRLHLNCSSDDSPFLKMRGQPLALDYDHNTIVDLFGMDKEGKKTVWLFKQDRSSPEPKPLQKDENSESVLRTPHSHAFFDVNNDYAPDLYLSVKDGYEIWLQEDGEFKWNETILKPKEAEAVGQSLFVDLELEGVLLHMVPACKDKACRKSTILVYYKNDWRDLNPDFRDWGFAVPEKGKESFTDTTLRAGDFNMDGYPDLLATLVTGKTHKAFLLENVPCETKPSCGGLSRTFKVLWDTLSPMNNDTSLAVFYDLYQDGVLDIILATDNRVQAFRNTLDYDANFVKVMVLGGREKGASLPGPRISYRTITQEGRPRTAVSAQLPQSAHFTLGLPYSIFGLGRTPNFVDTLTVGVGGQSREWTQIIPNSQMVVVPYPPSSPSSWRARLFVTPSKLILLSVAALTGTCCLIVTIIIGLYWKERREDRIEKLQEAHRFHFDAM